MDSAAIDWLTEAVLQADAGDHPIGPAALTLLLRRYAATGREDVRDAVGRQLARALDAIESPDLRGPAYGPTFPPPLAEHHASLGGPDEASRAKAGRSGAGDDPAGWLMLFAEASTLADDERMPAAVAALVTAVRREWPARGRVGPAMRSAGACLAAAPVLENETDARNLIAAAIDEMERMIGRIYRPGEPLARSLQNPDEPDAELSDHVETASALLTAHAITGRLPYSMLAEELIQIARRTWWDADRGAWKSEVGSLKSEECATCCEAARVLCRLAMLHEDEDYRAAAVTATDADYLGDAERTLTSLSSSYREHGIAAAIYGVALDELRGLR